MGVLICLEDADFSSVGLIPRSWIAALCGGHIFNFLRNLCAVCCCSCSSVHSPAVHEGSSFTSSSPSLVFLITTLTGIGGIALWLQFVFPWWLVMLNIIPYTCWPSVCPLRECLFMLSPLPFHWICSFAAELYILETSPLSGTWLTNIFSYSVDHLLTLLMFYFFLAMQKFFSLMSCLFVFYLLARALGMTPCLPSWAPKLQLEHLELVESPLFIHLLGECLLNTYVPGAVLSRLSDKRTMVWSTAVLWEGQQYTCK